MHVVFDARTVDVRFPGIARYGSCLLTALAQVAGADERITAIVRGSTSVPGAIERRVALSGPLSARQQVELPGLLDGCGADLVHFPYFVLPYGCRLPLVLTIHDVTPLVIDKVLPPAKTRLYRMLLNMALRRARAVIAVSRNSRDDLLEQFDIDPGRVFVTPLAAGGMFSPRGDAAVGALKERLGLPHRYVLYVGGNKPHKNLARLIRCWRRIHTLAGAGFDWGLVLAGRWEDRFPDPGSYAGPQQDSGIRVLGGVDGELLPVLYSGAGLFVFPSLYEGFGLPVVEAMACGVPVACSAGGSLPEVTGGAARMFDPQDVEDMARTILAVLDDDQERSRLAASSLQRAASFDWTETARRTLDVYRFAAS